MVEPVREVRVTNALDRVQADEARPGEDLERLVDVRVSDLGVIAKHQEAQLTGIRHQPSGIVRLEDHPHPEAKGAVRETPNLPMRAALRLQRSDAWHQPSENGTAPGRTLPRPTGGRTRGLPGMMHRDGSRGNHSWGRGAGGAHSPPPPPLLH